MLNLKYKGNTTIPVEAEVITPDQFVGKTLAEIANLPVQHGNVQLPLSEFFDIDGDPSDEHVRIEGDCSRVKWIGAGMKSGKITVQSDVGMHLGSEMTGGEIEVFGNAADWVGGEMIGGRIHVHGNAGHLVGAGYRGSRLGMRGGAILIDGKAGNEIGATMRRGFIAIGGDTGDFVGVSLIAGTIFVFGNGGIRPGANMKRGTLAFFGPPVPLLPTFRFDCQFQPVFMQMYLRQLNAWDYGPARAITGGSFNRYSGDLVSLGKGEILFWQR